jgi:hypothetical protein
MVFSTKLVTAIATNLLILLVGYVVAKFGFDFSAAASAAIPAVAGVVAGAFAGWFVPETDKLVAEGKADVSKDLDKLPVSARLQLQAAATGLEASPALVALEREAAGQLYKLEQPPQ